MNRRFSSRVLLALLVLGIVMTIGPNRTKACGPFFSDPVFVSGERPDLPYTRFVAGGVGLVRTKWARSYLFVAYRYLAERPPDAAEQQRILARWADGAGAPGGGSESARDAWLAARRGVPGASDIRSIDVTRPVPASYSSYVNCTADAFATAKSTLAARLQRFGSGSPAVRDWLAAQDSVFSNCSGGRTIPPPLAESAPAAFRADRDYQVAAALFYAGDFAAARGAFKRIAADRSSAWRAIAPYLAARALVRQRTVSNDRASLEEAARELKQLQGDATTAEYRPAIERLLEFVRLRTEPEQRLRELGAELSRGESGEATTRRLGDYTFLLDRQKDAGPTYWREPDWTIPPEAISAVRQADEMTDWILTVQGAAPRTHAVERWRKTLSPAWLVAALAAARPGDAEASELVDAAGRVSESTPAFPSATCYAIQLMIGAGQADKARARIDAVLPLARKTWTRSALNALLAMRLGVARDLGEFAAAALRQPAYFVYDSTPEAKPQGDVDMSDPIARGRATLTFASDAAITLDTAMPAAKLLDLAAIAAVPVYLRRELAIAAWTRAELAGDAALADRAAAVVADVSPEFRAAAEEYRATKDEAARRFVFVLAALRNPGVSPYVWAGMGRGTPIGQMNYYQDNWWCHSSFERAWLTPSESDADKPLHAFTWPAAPFPGPAERAAADAEWKKIDAGGAGPSHLSREAVAFARAHPDDPRVPESLALAVRATRFGPGDADTTKWSRTAFTLLHQKYPNTTWAKQTKYYY